MHVRPELTAAVLPVPKCLRTIPRQFVPQSTTFYGSTPVSNRTCNGCYSGREVRQERRLRLLRGNRLSAWETISQTIAQLLVRSWDNGWDNRTGFHTRPDRA